MAAELPIVSTNITDVAVSYSDIAYIAHSHDDFVTACEKALAAPQDEVDARVLRHEGSTETYFLGFYR